MSSGIILKNDIKTELTITHTDGSEALTIGTGELKQISKISYPVASEEEFLNLETAPNVVNFTDGRYGNNSLVKTDEVLEDNGGTIRKTNDGTTYKLIYEGALNVKWFGAKGDGLTDDTVAIQKTINAVDDKNTNVYIPRGMYLISNTIGRNDIKNIALSGDSAQMIATDTFPHYKFFIFTASDEALQEDEYRQMTFSGIFFNGKRVPKSESGEANDCLYLTGDDDRIMHNVTVSNCKFYTGTRRETSGSDSHIFVAGIDSCTITNNEFTGANDAALYISGNQSQLRGKNAIVTGNRFYFCNIGYISKRTFKRTIYSNNVHENCYYGIVQGEGDAGQPSGIDEVIDGNSFTLCAFPITVRQSNGASINGNLIKDIGYTDDQGEISDYASAISLQGACNCSITGNSIVGVNPDVPQPPTSSYNAVKLVTRTYEDTLYESFGNLIIGNTVSGVGALGYGYVEDEVYDNSFTNNQYNGTNLGLVGISPKNYLSALIGGDYGMFITNGDNTDITLSTYKGKLGIGHNAPQRKFHLADGYAASSAAGGAPSTRMLLESDGSTLINMISKAGDDNIAGIVFGSDTSNTLDFLKWSPDNRKLSYANACVSHTSEFRKFENSDTTISSTDYVDVGSCTYTVKNSSCLITIQATLKFSIDTHDEMYFEYSVDGDVIATDRASDSSGDYSTFNGTSVCLGQSDDVKNQGDLIQVKVRAKTVNGNDCTVGNYTYCLIQEQPDY